MITKRKEKLFLYLFPFVIGLFYASEAYFKIISYCFGNSTLLLKLTKLAFIVAICFSLLYRSYKKLFFPLVLVVVFCSGQLSLVNPFRLEVVVVFVKYLYPILLLLFFDVYKLSPKQKAIIFRTFEIVIFINSLLVLIGFLFDIYIFETYSGERFGYNGLLITSATGSYFYIIALLYLFLKDKLNFFKTPFSYLVIVAALLVGTKAIYMFFIGFLILYLFYNVKKKVRNILLVSISFLTFLFFYVFFFKVVLFNNIRESEGLVTAIMSRRDILFVEKTLPFIQNQWQFLNYIFGGIDEVSTKSQIDLIDVFYFFGFFGGIIYLFTYNKLFFSFNTSIQVKWLLGLAIFIIFIAGNFFSYASIAIYVLILHEFLCDYERD